MMGSIKLHRAVMALLLGGAFAAPAQALVISATDTPLYVDGSSATSTLLFPTSGVITKMTVTLDFMKCSTEFTAIPAGCPPDSGFSFPEEIIFRLTSPDGTTISLIEADTYSDLPIHDPGNFRISVTFDDAAATMIGGPSVPADGSFKPIQQLALFNLEDPQGNWILYAEDTGFSDPLVLHGFSLDISFRELPDGQAPIPGTLALFGLGLAGLGALKRRR